MNSVWQYFLFILKSILDTKSLAKYIAITVLKLQGFKAWLATIFLKKTIDKAKDEVTSGIDKAQDSKAAQMLRKEMAKPLKEIDWKLVDQLEREILEGK